MVTQQSATSTSPFSPHTKATAPAAQVQQTPSPEREVINRTMIPIVSYDGAMQYALVPFWSLRLSTFLTELIDSAETTVHGGGATVLAANDRGEGDATNSAAEIARNAAVLTSVPRDVVEDRSRNGLPIAGNATHPQTFQLIEAYMRLYAFRDPQPARPLSEAGTIERALSEPDLRFISAPGSAEFVRLYEAATFFSMPHMCDMCDLRIATFLRDMDADTIRQTLGAEDDDFANANRRETVQKNLLWLSRRASD